MWFTDTEFYWAVKKNEIMTPAGKWMHLEIIHVKWKKPYSKQVACFSSNTESRLECVCVWHGSRKGMGWGEEDYGKGRRETETQKQKRKYVKEEGLCREWGKTRGQARTKYKDTPAWDCHKKLISLYPNQKINLKKITNVASSASA